MTLPADVTRCLDAGCPERHECLRWICRDPLFSTEGGQPQWAARQWAASLFPYDLPLGERCPAKIDAPARSVIT